MLAFEETLQHFAFIIKKVLFWI